jgi:hypothetical protein
VEMGELEEFCGHKMRLRNFWKIGDLPEGKRKCLAKIRASM